MLSSAFLIRARASTRILRGHPKLRRTKPDVPKSEPLEANTGVFKKGDRVVFTQPPAIDPCQVGRLNVIHMKVRSLFDEVFDKVAVNPEIVDEGQSPWLGFPVSRQCRGEPQCIDVGHDASHGSLET